MIGIDINDRALKIVEIKEGPKGLSLVNAAMQSGPISGKGLQKLFHSLNIADKNVYTVVSGKQVVVYPKLFPFMTEKELREAIYWEAKDIISFPLEKAVVSFKKLGERLECGVKKIEVLLVVVEKDLLAHIQALMEEAGLKVKGISVAPFALWDLAHQKIKAEKEEGYAILDIGTISATFNAFWGGDLKFVREISIAGQAFTNALTAEPLKLSKEKAEEIKLSQGFAQEGDIYLAMKPVVDSLSQEILQTIGYVSEKTIVPKIGKLYLVGGSSRLKNLDSYLSKALSLEVKVLDPLEGMEVAVGLDKENLGSHLAVALGLAIGKAQNLNLLNVIKRKSDALNLPIKEIFRWVLAIGLVGALVFCSQYYLNSLKARFSDELRGKQAELASLQKPSVPIIEKGKGLEIMLKHLRGLLPASFTLEELTFERKGNVFSFVGALKKQENVSELIYNLQSSDKLKKVKMGEVRKEGDAVQVQIELELK